MNADTVNISIHEALANLDDNPERLKRLYEAFRSTRLSRTSTAWGKLCAKITEISIHEALANLDNKKCHNSKSLYHFDPRGSREPRLRQVQDKVADATISIHEALANLDK